MTAILHVYLHISTASYPNNLAALSEICAPNLLAMKNYIIRALLLLTFAVSPALVHAQAEVDITNLLNLTDRVGGSAGKLLYTRAGSYYGVMGTPYINESWVRGTVYDDRGQKHENMPVMYNAHYDLVEAIVGRDTLILDSRKITKVEMPVSGKDTGVRLAVFKNGFSSRQEKIEPHMFYEVLHEGEEFTVLKKHYKNLKKSDFNPAYNTGSKYDEFQYIGTVYVRKPDGSIEKVRTNKKGILGQFGSKSKQVEDFVKKESLEYDDDLHLGRIFAYYETL